jgi:hypothetical protein
MKRLKSENIRYLGVEKTNQEPVDMFHLGSKL